MLESDMCGFFLRHMEKEEAAIAKSQAPPAVTAAVV